jgi:hypothetical protein
MKIAADARGQQLELCDVTTAEQIAARLEAASKAGATCLTFPTSSDHVGYYPNNDQTSDPPRQSLRAKSRLGSVLNKDSSAA